MAIIKYVHPRYAFLIFIINDIFKKIDHHSKCHETTENPIFPMAMSGLSQYKTLINIILNFYFKLWEQLHHDTRTIVLYDK